MTPTPSPRPSRPPGPVPNPAAMASHPPSQPRVAAHDPRTTTPLPQQSPPAAPAPSQQAFHVPRGPIPGPDGSVGDGPIRVVCRRCQRTVWGWKLPFGVSCPIGPHHSHINWFMVGVVASFWTAFVVVFFSLIGIAAS